MFAIRAPLDKEKPCPCCKLWKKSKAGEPHRHYGEKDPNRPFHCEVCNKSFRQEAHLKKHLNVHTNEKPFPCHICSKRFASSDTLKKHLRIHSGEKPFPCEICGKGFRQKAHVERHMKSHNKTPFYAVELQGGSQVVPASRIKNEPNFGRKNHNIHLPSGSTITHHTQIPLHIPIPQIHRP